ncbi:hypothetical protein [Mycobacterium genavense]|uniref:hypothetical protein n=1 Tax=Mycobacterium genavense TaxID=36812 RepID=UPI00047252D3|nr:hypothetical protein [Mycobacterium genavense]
MTNDGEAEALAPGGGPSDGAEAEADLLSPAGDDHPEPDSAAEQPGRRRRIMRALVSVVLPVLAMLAGVGAAWMKYQDATIRAVDDARFASVQAANKATVAMLSYTPDTADAKLTAAANLLTGPFRNSYEDLVKKVVIPGAKQKQIATTATVPAAASEWATESSAAVLVFVDQTITVGTDAPTNTTSVVEVSLTKTGGKWLISGFDPK